MVNWAALASEVVETERRLADDERRSAQRVALQTPTRARMISDRSGARSPTLVKDLSLTGIGLVMGVELIIGQFIVLELHWHGRAQLALAQVVFCRRMDEGMFRVGAEFFEELPAEAEIPNTPESWLARLPTPA